MEVSLCIMHFYDISCRIVHAQSGADVVDALPMLKSHFESGGGPVMIGGGVKAFTIIGVRMQAEEVTIALYCHFIDIIDSIVF